MAEPDGSASASRRNGDLREPPVRMSHHPTGAPPDEPKRRAAGSPPELDAESVAAYLRRHPDFLVRRADLATLLVPPPRDMGEGVIDLQGFIVERLRADVSRLKLAQRKLISTSRNNLTSQTRVHAAVLALLAAPTFEHLISVVTEELGLILDIDAVGLCVERAPDAVTALPSIGLGVHVLEPGEVDHLIGADHDVLLRSDVVGDPRLFGAAAAGLVRSDALVRLKVSSGAPIGLLALGARRPGIFHPGQGTDLLGFLAHVIEHSIRAWLDLPE